MPPKWPRKPDRNDPAFRRLDDRMTFATHVALFAAVNSSLWFFHLYRFPGWNWMSSFSSCENFSAMDKIPWSVTVSGKSSGGQRSC